MLYIHLLLGKALVSWFGLVLFACLVDTIFELFVISHQLL